MSGIYGNSQEDRYFEKLLDDHLAEQYEGSDAQAEEWAAELTEQLLATGQQSPYISSLNDLIVELVAKECDRESELAAIIVHALKDPEDAGNRLAALTEKHIAAYVDNNYEEVRDHLHGPQEEDAA